MLNHSKYNRDVGWVLQGENLEEALNLYFCVKYWEILKLFPWCCRKLIQEEQINEFS